jgi:hypothetical protein
MARRLTTITTRIRTWFIPIKRFQVRPLVRSIFANSGVSFGVLGVLWRPWWWPGGRICNLQIRGLAKHKTDASVHNILQFTSTETFENVLRLVVGKEMGGVSVGVGAGQMW